MRLRDDDDREGTVDAGCIERLFIGEPCDGHMEERRSSYGCAPGAPSRQRGRAAGRH
jgi:hypothetical protein